MTESPPNRKCVLAHVVCPTLCFWSISSIEIYDSVKRTISNRVVHKIMIHDIAKNILIQLKLLCPSQRSSTPNTKLWLITQEIITYIHACKPCILIKWSSKPDPNYNISSQSIKTRFIPYDPVIMIAHDNKFITKDRV